ncbi:MAG: hypothetical protein ACKVH8_11170 [Pirellulales bacterium]
MKRTIVNWNNRKARLMQAATIFSCLLSMTACSLTGRNSLSEPARPDAGLTFEEIKPETQSVAPNSVSESSLATPTDPKLAYPVQQTAATEPVASEGPATNSVLESTQINAPGPANQRNQTPYYTRYQPQAAPQNMPPQNENYGVRPRAGGCQFCGPQGGCVHCQPGAGPQTYGYPFQFPPCWPEDEYLFDGGDRDVATEIDSKFGVHGLNIEDTVGHFDTLDGRREVTPSNRVCIYAPRFAAVRKVYGLSQSAGNDIMAGFRADLHIENQQMTRIASNMNQPLELDQNVGTKTPNIFRERLRGVGLENKQYLIQFEEDFLPYENFNLIRRGQYDVSEKARLTKSLENAASWNDNVAIQVVIEGQQAYEAGHDGQAQQVLKYEMPPGKPRMRVVKAAAKGDALPGEIVEFTIRFDNLGDQRIGNVTIIDNLTPRLELVENSAQCDIDAEFITQDNELGSLILRWEINEPLEVGEGGIVRFKARVR